MDENTQSAPSIEDLLNELSYIDEQLRTIFEHRHQITMKIREKQAQAEKMIQAHNRFFDQLRGYDSEEIAVQADPLEYAAPTYKGRSEFKG